MSKGEQTFGKKSKVPQLGASHPRAHFSPHPSTGECRSPEERRGLLTKSKAKNCRESLKMSKILLKSL